MPDGSRRTILFRPDGRGYRAVRDATLALVVATAFAAVAGYQPLMLWICAALFLFALGSALVSAKLIVGPDRVSFCIVGMAIDFPAADIEKDRFDELAFMNFFQVSVPNGRFLLIPHAAFSDTAAFDAIIALARQQEHGRDGATAGTQTPREQ